MAIEDHADLIVPEEHAIAILRQAAQHTTETETGYTIAQLREGAVRAGVKTASIDAVLTGYLAPRLAAEEGSLRELLELQTHIMEYQIAQFIRKTPALLSRTEKITFEQKDEMYKHIEYSIQTYRNNVQVSVRYRATTAEGYPYVNEQHDLFFLDARFKETEHAVMPAEKEGLLTRIGAAWKVLVHGVESIRPPRQYIVAEPPQEKLQFEIEGKRYRTETYDDLEQFVLRFGMRDSCYNYLPIAIDNLVPALWSTYNKLYESRQLAFKSDVQS
jgi:hypothetical protein